MRGEGVYLRSPEMRDFEQWAALRHLSRSFLTPWEPTWPSDDLTRTSFRRRLRRHAAEIENDEAYPFLIFRDGDDALLGGLTFGQIKRGVAQAATLGYWMGEPFAGHGFMARAVARGDGLRVRHVAATSDRGGLPAAQRPFDPAPDAHQFRPRGDGARLSANQRALAGPPAVRSARIRSRLAAPAAPGQAVTAQAGLALLKPKLYGFEAAVDDRGPCVSVFRDGRP